MTAATAKRITAQLSFEHANALVFDPVAVNRATTRTALGMLGFRQITATSVFEELAQLLRGRVFDLMIADVTQETARSCGIIRTIREGQAGANPFMHVVLMAWKLEGDLVQRALNCGADDLVTRPFSVDFLGARIKAHAEARKQFVVTSDYIGPDRRRNKNSRPSTTALIDVPNTLFARAQEQQGAARPLSELMDEIKDAGLKVDAERARRDAFQVAFLLRFLKDSLAAVAPLENDLRRLELVVKDLTPRVHGPEAEAVTKHADAILEEAAGALLGENVAGRLTKMEESAAALLEVLNPPRQRAELLEEVDAAVAAVKNRGRKD